MKQPKPGGQQQNTQRVEPGGLQIGAGEWIARIESPDLERQRRIAYDQGIRQRMTGQAGDQ